MITFYNWRNLRRKPVQEILKSLTSKEILQKMGYPKDSFLINVHKLVENSRNATEDEIYVYLDLASMRNYYEYKYTKNNRLKTFHVTNYEIKLLKMNVLLDIVGNEIIFNYEE